MSIFRSIKWKVVAVMSAVLIAFGVFIVAIFYYLYNTSQENIINMWRNTAILSGQEMGYFIADSVDALDFTAKKINLMSKQKAPAEEALDYLEEESEIYPDAVAGNENGVYAYYRGEYLDGYGWVPPEGFEPTSRPWYKEAKAAGGDIILATPYRDQRTDTIITTAAKILDDGESVVAMDIILDDIHRMTKESSAGGAGNYALVLDASGHVVSHSNKKEIGKNFKEEDRQLWNLISEEVFNSDGNDFTLSLNEGGAKYIVFAKKINSSWVSVLMLNEGKIFKSLKYIYIESGLALVAVVVVFMILVFYITAKIAQADRLRHLSETDRLTGINNRGAGEQKIKNMMAARTNGLFILLDADDFKSVNDNYGHDVGDKVIIAIADCLKASFRESDVVMRLGGDEFAAYANGVADREIARQILDRMFARLDAVDIPELGDRNICISVGAAFYKGEDNDFTELYKRADEGTYQSKRIKGNSVTFK